MGSEPCPSCSDPAASPCPGWGRPVRPSVPKNLFLAPFSSPPWLFRPLHPGQAVNFPVAVETGMGDTLQDRKAQQKMALCTPGTRPLWGPSPGGWLGSPCWSQNPTMSSEQRQGPHGEGDRKVPITRGVLRASQGLRSPQLGHPRPPWERPYREIPSFIEILSPSRGCPGGGRGRGLGGQRGRDGVGGSGHPRGSVPGAVAWRLPGGAWGAGRCRLPELPLFAFNQDVSGGIKSTNWGNHHHKKSCACKIGQVRLQRERASDLHGEEEWQQL